MKREEKACSGAPPSEVALYDWKRMKLQFGAVSKGVSSASSSPA